MPRLGYLVVQAVVVAGVAERVAASTLTLLALGELEEGTGAGVLHLLSKGLVAANLNIADGAAGHLHGLLEVRLGEDGDGVLGVIVIQVHVLAGGLALLGAGNIGVNRLLDGNLGGALSNEADIGTGEAVGLGGNEAKVHVGGDGGLAELSLENAQTTGLIGQGNVDERVETARTAQGRVELLGSVGGTNDEDVLLGGHAVHLGKELVDDTVGSTASIADGATTGLGNRIQLIEENNARSSGAGLVKDVTNVGLGLTEPHAQQLRTLDGDEVGSALIGDSLGQHSLTGTGGTVEQDTTGWRETKLEELFRVVDGVLDLFAEILLDLLETTDILPADVGNLDNSDLAKGGGVGDAEGEAEVLHGDAEGVENLGIDGVLVEIDEVHLLTDLLHGGLGAESSHIGTDVTMGLGSNLLQVDVVTKLHVLGVDLENLETAGRVGDANVDLAIETAETTQSRVDRVGTVGGSHDDDVGAGLHTVHEGEELGDDTALDLTVGLLTLGGDGVDFINEDDGGGVLLGLLEGLAQVGLGLTGHLGHDFGTVDEEEEGTGFVGDGTGHQSLTGTGGAIEQDTTGRLDTDGLEELRVAQRKLNHLADLSHLLAATTNVVVADLVEVVLLLVALNGLALAVDDGILGDNAVLGGIDLDHLELDLSHTAADDEEVALADGAVGLTEVGGEENVEEGASDALDGVGNGENSNALGLKRVLVLRLRAQVATSTTYIFNVGARLDGNHVAVLDAEVVANDTVDAGTAVIEVLVGENDEDGVLSLLATDKNCVTTEELELLHGIFGEGNDTVVIVDGIGDPRARLVGCVRER